MRYTDPEKRRQARIESTNRWRIKNINYYRDYRKRYQAEKRESAALRIDEAAHRANLNAIERCKQFNSYITQCPQELKAILKLYKIIKWANYLEGIDGRNKKAMEIDHIIPISKGGSHTIENLQVLSRGENLCKQSKVM